MADPVDTKMGTNPELESINLPPVVIRSGKIVLEIGVGALGGYICYWITRLIVKLGLLGEMGKNLTPLPFVLSGMVSAAIVEAAKLSYDISLYILGDREKLENLTPSGDHSAFDRLRQRCWKVISKMEEINETCDAIFSGIFGMRTNKEIRERGLSDRIIIETSESYLPGLREFSRRAFWEQVHETISTAVPQELGIYVVESYGYVIFGGQVFIWIHALSFFTGLMQKVTNVYEKYHKDCEQRIKNEAEFDKFLSSSEFEVE